MSNWRLKFIYIMSTFFICLISFDFAIAAFNPMINYQGKLTDSSDAAVTDGDYNLRIKLCADSSCSSVLWTETRTDADKVQVTNGLFSILLGEVSTSSLSTIDFNQDIYLQLEVGGTGVPAFETLLPRKRFASVPAAFEAAKLGGLASSSYAKLATNETISGAWSFGNILSITSNSASPALNVLQSGAGSGFSVGNGISTTTINGAATSTFPYGATFATAGGKVGIGTLTPAYALDVNGTVNGNLVQTFLFSFGWTDTFDSNMSTPKNYFNLGSDWHGSGLFSSNVYIQNDVLKIANTHSTISGSVLKIPGNGKANQGSFVFYTAPAASVTANATYAGSVRMEIGADGTVGIGTTGAGKALEINSATGVNMRLTYNDSDGSATNYSDFSVGSDGALTIGTSNSATTTITNGLVVNTNSLVVNKTTGYVGIGTITPTYKLSVAGDIDTTGTIRINGSDYGQYFISSTGTSGQLWQSDGSAAGAWVNTSSLGIMPSGSTGQTIRYGVSGWESSSALTVNSSGYVGIGTASPITILTNSATNSSDYRGYGVQLGTGLVWKASGAGYGIAFEQVATGAARNGALFKTASADADATIFVAESGSTGRVVARADGYVGFNIPTDYSGISANYTFNQLVKTSGSPTMMLLTAAAHTTLAASTEATDLNFNLARTVQFSTGAIATQRAAVIRAPTYGAVGASTISTAATLALTGAPISGTNVTITNPLALWVQSGSSQFDGGNILHNATGSPTLKSTISSNSSASGLFVLGKYLYLADYTAGLKIVDISNPTIPIQVGVIAGLSTRSVYVSGRYAYVGVADGLAIVDISNPYAPILTGTLSGRGVAKGIYVSGKFAYIADYTYGLDVVDISNPTSPILRGNYRIGSTSYSSGIYVSGRYAYVSVADTYSLRIIDISNPSSPILAGTIAVNGLADYQGIHVSGKYAYIAASTAASGLKILDISNPASPVVTSTLALPLGANGVYVSGKYAYMAHSTTGLSVVDISNPVSPLLVGTLDTANASKVFVSGKYAYVLDGTGGTLIIDINGIDTPTLNAGNIATGDLAVYENVDIGNSLSVRSGVNVGVGGMLVGGSVAITVSTTITTTTLFSVATSSPFFVISANGYVGVGTSSPAYNMDISGDVNFTGALRINGNDYSQFFISSTGTSGYVWQSDGSGAGAWVTTSSLGISGGSMPSGTSGQVMRYGPTGWEGSYDLSFNELSYVGIGTSSASYKLDVYGDINSTGGVIRLNGTNYSQYFIDSTGTAGSVWLSGGSGAGHWATTSSLGISGGSMPSGSLGQTIAYGSSGWVATSTLYVSGTSLFNSTSTFSGNIINSNGIFISGVSSGNSGSTELLFNTGFESSASSISPWAVTATSGSATYAIGTSSPNPVSGSNWLLLNSGAITNYVVLEQTGLSNPGSTAMTLSFYGLGQVAGEKLRTVIMGDSCGVGGEKWAYNFTMFSWDCINFTGASYSFYAKDFTFSAVYAQYSVAFTSLSAASSTGGLTLLIMVGSSDAGTYHGQTMVVDDFSLSYDGSTQNTAFILNAQNFSATSTSDTLLSVRSNNTEKLSLTSGGNLSISGNMNVTGTYKLNGTDIGQYFISSAGTSGQLWQSDGSGAGTWVNTSSLGILPSGTSGQIMTYSGSGWIATSSAQLTSLSVNGTLGVGTSAPSTIQFEVMSATLNQLKISYNSSNYAIFGVDSSGNLDITPTSTGSTFTDGFNSSWPPSSWSSGGNAMWQQNLITTYEGAGAAQSGTITGDQTTWFDIDMQTVGGDITFWWKVSSESNWDKLAFCYDMDGSCTKDAGSISSISGEVGWVQVTYPITAGSHSFRWLYGKDSTANSGADAGYIDNISIPTPAGQVLVTVNSNGAFSGALLVGTTTPFASSSNYMLQVDSGSNDGDGIAVNGHIIASSYITGTTTVDLAESYPVLADCKLDNSCPEAGDTVCSKFVSTTYYIEKCTEKASKKALGVITTNPGFVLGGKSSGVLLDDNSQILRAVALAGRVPVKVSMVSGTIEVGDEITVSDMSGFATKAVEPGRIIGTALTSFDPLVSGVTGTMEIFVNPHWSIGQIEEKDIPTELPDFSSTSTPTILDQFTLVIENSLQKLGLVIKNGVAKLKEIFVDKIFVKQLCVGDTCIGEQQLKDLLEKNQISQLQTNTQSVLNNTMLSEPTVVLNESTSTFSSFSSSSEVITGDTSTAVPLTLTTDVIVPTLNSIIETTVPLDSAVENILPSILTTDNIVTPQPTSAQTESNIE